MIIDAVRTPLGKRNGGLAGVHPGELLGFVQREVLARAGVDPALVEQVVGGVVTQAGEQSNDMVRRAWLHAGLPQPTGATTIDAQCGSGQQATHFVHDMIRAGTISVGLACGVESMSRVPLGANVPEGAGDPRPESWSIDMPNQFEGADRIARHRGLTRADLEAFGCESQRRARVAVDEGRFKREIAAYGEVVGRRGPPGHHARGPGRAADRAAGRAAHRGHVLPDQRRRLGRAPDGRRPRRLARPDATGADRRPRAGRVGPVLPPRRADRRDPADPRADRSLPADLDLYEVNEAFAAVVLSWAQQTGADLERTNVNGGAIALGHPVGSTGTRLITTALHELERTDGTRALVSMCAGGAMATGTILERV